MPKFSSKIEEIANYVGEQVYLRGFPVAAPEHPKGLNRDKQMEDSPPRRLHGFDNANRSAALLPYIVKLLHQHAEELPLAWQKQLAQLNDETIKALQIVALMRASGRHFNPAITPKYGNNPDFGNGTEYARFGEVECLAMLEYLDVPKELDHKRLAHAVVGNEYVSSNHANSSNPAIKKEHEQSKDDVYSLLLNVLNVLETTRDLKKKEVDLNWMSVFKNLGDQGKKDFIALAKKHVGFIKDHQGFLWTTTKADSQIIVSPDPESIPKYNGAKFKNAQDMFEAIARIHGDSLLEYKPLSQDKEKPESTKKAEDITHYYKHFTEDPAKTRWHFFSVTSNQSLHKGDVLKSTILKKFEQILRNTNSENLPEKIEQLEKTDDYKILAQSQGIITRLFHLKTSSVLAFEKMCEDFIKTGQQDSHKPSGS